MEIPSWFAIENDITFNAMRKTYPDGSSVLIVSDKAIFREPGWEAVESRVRLESDPVSGNDGEEPSGGRSEASAERSMRRARAKLRDIARATPFSWFVTFTLDKERIDRYDVAAITAKLNVWLDNRVRRRGLAYVLVPERHKDGAVHFHGLINEALDADMVPSGHRDKEGHEVFNLGSWGYGFSTAIRLYGDYRRAVGYVCKYIGKQTEKIGGRWYYSGGKLGQPKVERFRAELDLDELGEAEGAYTFQIPGARARCVYLDCPGGI